MACCHLEISRLALFINNAQVDINKEILCHTALNTPNELLIGLSTTTEGQSFKFLSGAVQSSIKLES